jgi:ribosome-binding factor A
MSQRTERIDELLRQEISQLLAKDVADPGVGFATLTEVETSSDLSHARVWFSVIGQPDERTKTLRALQRAMPFVRHELGRRLRIRRIPELEVRLDDSAARGTRVLHILDELREGALPQDLPEGEILPTPAPRAGQGSDLGFGEVDAGSVRPARRQARRGGPRPPHSGSGRPARR